MSKLIFTDDNFEAEVLKSEAPVLVDFYATWCGPCQMLGPIVEDLAEEMAGKSVKIGKLDVDTAPQTAEKYGVMSIPTMIIFKGGKEVERMVGMRGKDDLKAALEKAAK
ncbi:MAG: thioredoxin [Patescibacteria group bacterium]|jgi:thioredoxin 1